MDILAKATRVCRAMFLPAVFGLGLIGAAPAALAKDKFVALGTGSPNGTYFPVGRGICDLVNDSRLEHGVRCIAYNTGGSVYNIQAVMSGELEMGITRSDLAFQAHDGLNAFKAIGPNPEIRAVTTLYSMPIAVLVRKDAEIETFQDLEGKRINIGNKGSGKRSVAELIMNIMGWQRGDFSAVLELSTKKMGKALEDRGAYDDAFEMFAAGNALKRPTLDYDLGADRDLMRRIREVFTPDLLGRRLGGGDPDRLAIFILGIPRSGTSLVEQIVASHPDVAGAGELMFLTEISGGPDAFPANIPGLDADAFRRLGGAYLDRLRARAPAAARVTDKMPQNFLYVGLIALILPNARIVHCRRTPEDTCLSLYKTLFTDRLDFAYDLGELGAFHGLYAELMAHWRAVLPDAMLELHYEDLIADQAAETRRLLDYLELPWDDACLDFHRTERRVATASSVQVRQGLYSGSVEAWRRYEAHLDPLRAALGRDSA
ncbi:MAG: TAXI family TRAP transporter solute-binding subunit [Magnetovibrio sp.]|nr:TAXI family TRAP transporter solute-binding subunit [Magnetovibrio sp.]